MPPQQAVTEQVWYRVDDLKWTLRILQLPTPIKRLVTVIASPGPRTGTHQHASVNFPGLAGSMQTLEHFSVSSPYPHDRLEQIRKLGGTGGIAICLARRETADL